MKFENLAQLVDYNTEKFQSKIVHEQGGQKTILFAFAEGQGLKTHTAPHNVVLVALEGSCRFSIGGENQELKPGQAILIPSSEPHALEALSNFKMLLIR